MKHVLFLLIFIFTIINCSSDPGNNTPNQEIAVKYVYPENNETGIPADHKFIFQFDREIYFVEFTDNIEIKKADGSMVSYTFDSKVTNPGTLFLIKPQNLEPDSSYTITINKGLLSADESSKIMQTQTFSFTTLSATPENTEGIDDYNPGRIDSVLTSSLVKLIFNKHLYPFFIISNEINNTVAVKLVKIDTNTILDSTVDYDFGSRAIVIYPTLPLQKGIPYKAVYSGALTDLVGKDLGGSAEVEYEFTL